MAVNSPYPKLAFNFIEPANGKTESLSPFIFLHAFGGSKEFWHDIPQNLSDVTGRQSYVIDVRDHGDSEWTDFFTFTIAVDDLIQFMDSKSIPKVVLIGHSMGGWIASRIALRMPERVDILFIEDMLIHKTPRIIIESSFSYLTWWQEAARNIPMGSDEAEATRFAVDYVYSKIPEKVKTYYTKKEKLYSSKFPLKRLPDGSYDVKHNMKVFKVSTQDAESMCDDPEGVYTGPTYVLYGNASQMKLKQHEGIIREHFPFARMISFDNATHNVHVEFPKKFTETVLKCLQKHSTFT